MNDRIRYIKDNKQKLAEEKIAAMKTADAVSFCRVYHNGRRDATKAEGDDQQTSDTLDVEVVINTTGLLDSHNDVHIAGLWDEDLAKHRKRLVYLLQEHDRDFDKVISDEVEVSVETRSWQELGAPFDGDTQALVFKAKVRRERNKFMFEQYLNGWVRNHSVGMRYVDLELCVNSEEKYYIDEKEAWDKYIDQVANREEAEELGYFWAVTKAELVEGSAVLMGSNWVTPTLIVTPKAAPEPEQVSPFVVMSKFFETTNKHK